MNTFPHLSLFLPIPQLQKKFAPALSPPWSASHSRTHPHNSFPFPHPSRKICLHSHSHSMNKWNLFCRTKKAITFRSSHWSSVKVIQSTITVQNAFVRIQSLFSIATINTTVSSLFKQTADADGVSCILPVCDLQEKMPFPMVYCRQELTTQRATVVGFG